MYLDVSKGFLRPGTVVPFEAMVQLLPQDVMGETVTFEDVSLQGTYTVLENSIQVVGELQTTLHAHCAMCLAEVEQPVQLSFSETFRKDVDEMEGDAFRFDGKTLPLTQLVLTLVMLDVPMRFLCSEDCKGSAELQAMQDDIFKSSCEDGPATQRPFEALQHLLKKDEEV